MMKEIWSLEWVKVYLVVWWRIFLKLECILKMCVELINGAKKNGKYVAYDLILEK